METSQGLGKSAASPGKTYAAILLILCWSSKYPGVLLTISMRHNQMCYRVGCMPNSCMLRLRSKAARPISTYPYFSTLLLAWAALLQRSSAHSSKSQAHDTMELAYSLMVLTFPCPAAPRPSSPIVRLVTGCWVRLSSQIVSSLMGVWSGDGMSFSSQSH